MKSIEVLKVIRLKIEHPATVKELMQKLELPKKNRLELRNCLQGLVESGELIKVRGNRYGLPERMHLVTGCVHVNPRGFGFVRPEQPVEGLIGDLYIAGANLNQAIHGDRVVARIDHKKTSSRSEGRIVRILERATDRLVGRYDLDPSGLAFVVPFDRRVIMDVHVRKGEAGGATAGDMVMFELVRWPSDSRGAVGKVVEVLGSIDDPGVDTQIIVRKHGIPDEHSREVAEAADKLNKVVLQRDLKGRKDFRKLTAVTIDGDTARDFDDAITLERLENGNYWLGVHIADVSHYVNDGGLLDVAAKERGTSVYFPERAVHMFPDVLATGICSLRPTVDRLVLSCLMEIDSRGKVKKYEIHDGVIHSNARMTYSDVNSILEKTSQELCKKYEAFLSLFNLMAELCKVLNRRRIRRGAIDFDLPQAQFLMDEQGQIKNIVPSDRNTAHRLVEEFMLVANETVALHLSRSNLPALFRVHEPPDETKVTEFEAFVASLGFSLNVPLDRVSSKHFQRLIKALKGRVEERPVAYLMLRTMQQARYDVNDLGHFGLAAKSYTHFTSPIRRYPDLVVHRALKASRRKKTASRFRDCFSEKMPDFAQNTSQLERRAEEAEREVAQWKKVRFMANKVGDEFSGQVVGVTAFGLFVELVEYFVEGLVHISSMADDYYRFDDETHLLRGENTGKLYRLGGLVTVQLVRVDPEHRQLELALTDILDSMKDAESRSLKSRSQSDSTTVKRGRLRKRKGGPRKKKAKK